LINSVLDFSKIEAGKLELQSAPFDMGTVVEGAADVVAELARTKGVALHTYVDPAIPPLRGDADRLRQIILNLLGNAVKFTDRGYVVARALPLQTFEHDVVLRFDVQTAESASLPASRSASSSRSFKLTVRRRSNSAERDWGFRSPRASLN